MPPVTPACDQSMARFVSMIPDQACARATPGATAKRIMANRRGFLRFMLAPQYPMDQLALTRSPARRRQANRTLFFFFRVRVQVSSPREVKSTVTADRLRPGLQLVPRGKGRVIR